MDLSVLIPARQEDMLDRTLQDLLENIEANTEIIVVLDGWIPNPPLTHFDDRITLIYNPKPKGQRAATNQAAKIAKGKYLMKSDAHVAFDKGFDRKMLEAFKQVGDNVTMIPLMRNLHAYDWVCEAGHRRYQGKKGICPECGRQEHQEIVWKAKNNPQSATFRFGKDMHFQYWREYANTQTGDLVETMSIQGSCFMLTKEKYFELDICSEEFYGWGQQGVEVACKTWLSGGRVLCLRSTWYAHMFRTNNFGGFPYPLPQSEVDANRQKSREMFQQDQWPLAIHKFQWLLDKFNPPDWTLTKGIIYYTDNQTKPEIADLVKDQLSKIREEKHIPIVTSSLFRKQTFGNKNIFFPSLRIRGVLSQAKQILSALEHSSADIIYFCEADVLYHPSHFDFVPPEIDKYYYNVNVWKVRWSDGFAVKVNNLRQLSGLVASRQFMIRHYKRKIEIIEQRQKDILAQGLPLENEGVSKYMGYEPGMESKPRQVDDYLPESFTSEFPNLDIRHENNLTKNRWTPQEFVNQDQVVGWIESTLDKIPGWENHFTNINKKVNNKGMIYYTDNQLAENIDMPIKTQLAAISLSKNIPITSSSLKKMNFGVKNVFFPTLKRSYYALFKEVLGALENSKADIVFFTEHDVYYHPSHFDFTPPDKNTWYYNQNVWYLRQDGHAMHYDVNQLSGLCVYRETALIHFRERFKLVEEKYNELVKGEDKTEFNRFIRFMGFEPFTHGRIKYQKEFPMATWKSQFPNIDLRFGLNSTGMRWSKDQYRNQQLLINWVENDSEIPGWGNTKEIVKKFLP